MIYKVLSQWPYQVTSWQVSYNEHPHCKHGKRAQRGQMTCPRSQNLNLDQVLMPQTASHRPPGQNLSRDCRGILKSSTGWFTTPSLLQIPKSYLVILDTLSNACQGFDHPTADQSSEKPHPSAKGLQWSFCYPAMGKVLLPLNEGVEKVIPWIATGIDFIIDNLTHLSLIFILWIQDDLGFHIQTSLWNSNI